MPSLKDRNAQTSLTVDLNTAKQMKEVLPNPKMKVNTPAITEKKKKNPMK